MAQTAHKGEHGIQHNQQDSSGRVPFADDPSRARH